jgi:thymidylate synthase ThyX
MDTVGDKGGAKVAERVPQIFVHHDLHPEDGAMLQALYSRSPASVVEHLAKVREVGSGKFMSQYYVGYGHASIGDCGVTTVFLENYSMLAAKAIQDNPLYSGQEASTRYLDFGTQPQHDPYDHPASRAILDGWMALYQKTMPELQAALAKAHPFDPGQYKTEKVWRNTLAARAFDILRGFLPVGCTTLFSWTTNLRQARDRLLQLKHHPLPEIQQLARELFAELYAKYPNSFTGEEMQDGGRYAARDGYAATEAERDHVLSHAEVVKRNGFGPDELARLRAGEVLFDRRLLDVDGLRKHEAATLANRPVGAHLHRRLAAYGHYNLFFLLDFGSYRDVQRHRNGVCQVPLIDGTFGIFPWYYQQLATLLPEGFAAFKAEVDRLLAAIEALPQQGVATDKLRNQYLYPMGMALLCHLGYSVPQLTYVAELRSQATVHASLRPVAQALGRVLRQDFPQMALYMDDSADTWSAKRGEQTIEAKAA